MVITVSIHGVTSFCRDFACYLSVFAELLWSTHADPIMTSPHKAKVMHCTAVSLAAVEFFRCCAREALLMMHAFVEYTQHMPHICAVASLLKYTGSQLS